MIRYIAYSPIGSRSQVSLIDTRYRMEDITHTYIWVWGSSTSLFFFREESRVWQKKREGFCPRQGHPSEPGKTQKISHMIGLQISKNTTLYFYINILLYSNIIIFLYSKHQKRPKKHDFCKKIMDLAHFFRIFLGSLREKQYLCTCKPEGNKPPSLGNAFWVLRKMVLCFFWVFIFYGKTSGRH